MKMHNFWTHSNNVGYANCGRAMGTEPSQSAMATNKLDHYIQGISTTVDDGVTRRHTFEQINRRGVRAMRLTFGWRTARQPINCNRG